MRYLCSANSCGQFTTVEGLLQGTVAGLRVQPPLTRVQDANIYAEIQEIVDGLKEVITTKRKTKERTSRRRENIRKWIRSPMQVVPGNSFLEFVSGTPDSNCQDPYI